MPFKIHIQNFVNESNPSCRFGFIHKGARFYLEGIRISGSVVDTHFWLSHSFGRVSSECMTCAHPSNRSGPTLWNHHGV